MATSILVTRTAGKQTSRRDNSSSAANELRRDCSPTHIRPMIRQPAIEVWITGMVSDSSPSNTLQWTRRQNYFTETVSHYNLYFRLYTVKWHATFAGVQYQCRSEYILKTYLKYEHQNIGSENIIFYSTCKNSLIHQLQQDSRHLSSWRTLQLHCCPQIEHEPPWFDSQLL